LDPITSSFTIFKKLNFSHLITLICVILAFFSPEIFQNAFAVFGILTVGVLHGANDLKILAKKAPQKNNFLGIPFWSVYIGVVLLGIYLFYFIPGIALLSFVLVSCYHFGEQHWETRLSANKGQVLFYSAYGSLIFNLLFLFHFAEVTDVIFQIARVRIPLEWFWGLLILSSGLVLYFLIKNSPDYKSFAAELLLLALLSLLFFRGTLLFGFGIYFVFWHSLPSLTSQVRYLFEAQKKSAYKKYLKSAFLYWILALAGLVGFYFFNLFPKDQYLPVFFSFLAAITFPHVVVMGFMFHSSKSDGL
jgi:Brp/Blh family beta-carotene 15,15'-monooxygenase